MLWFSVGFIFLKILLNLRLLSRSMSKLSASKNQEPEAAILRCSMHKICSKWVFLKDVQNIYSSKFHKFLINFHKRRLQHMCFPVKFAELLRTHIFTEHLWWQLLKIWERLTLVSTLNIIFLNELKFIYLCRSLIKTDRSFVMILTFLLFYSNWGLRDLQSWYLSNLFSWIKLFRQALTLGSYLKVTL